MTAKRFRVAFSFASEKEDFVGQVAAILAKRFSEDEILYYKYHRPEFSRSDLGFYLPDLYENHADLIVAVLCPDYENKEWCGLEWSAIYGLLRTGKSNQVMLTRFELVEGKGLHGNAGYTDLDGLTSEQAADGILERLAINEGHPKDFYKSAGHDGKKSPRAIPNNLPLLPHFFGREKELATVAEALKPERRTWGALIDGPGGMGKTSLATRAAELVPAGQFKRIFFLSAKEREMTADGEKRLSGFILPGYLEMLNEIARQLKIERFAENPETERARILLEALTNEQALLILDNLESLTPEHRDLLFTFLGNLPQGCKAIATSRRRTDVDARIIRLEKLDPEAALDYLKELSEGRPHLQKATAGERRQLYEETGGNPLVIRWLVGQLGKGRCKTVAKALEFLRSAPPDNDPREFIFGDLLETFSETEEKVLAALAYFTSPIEVKHLAELGNVSLTAAQTALEDLADRALAVADAEQQRFLLVPLVADYIRHARPGIIKETGDRLEQRAYALIVENGYQRHDRFPVLDAAWPTVAPALPLFVAASNDRLQAVCAALANFLEFTGRWDERLSLNQTAEERAVAAGDEKHAGWRAYNAGWIHRLRGQADEVLTCADRAERYWRGAQAGARELSVAVRLRGIGHQLKKDYPAAITALREALDLDRSLDAESKDVATGLNDLASAERLSGDLDAAEKDRREALRIARKVGYAEGVAAYTGNLASLALDRKDWQAAEGLSREALPLSEKLGRLELVASNCHRLAMALARQDKHEEALPYARRSVEIYTRLGSPELKYALATLKVCETARET